MKPDRSQVLTMLIAFALLFYMSLPLPDLMPQESLFSPSQQFKLDPKIFPFIQTTVKDAGPVLFKRISVPLTVGVMASPTTELVSLQDLDTKGALLGTIYFPTGSLRLKLGPGLYTVFVKGKTAQLQDVKGESKRDVPVQVSASEKADRVLVTVEASICYKVNGGIVCI